MKPKIIVPNTPIYFEPGEFDGDFFLLYETFLFLLESTVRAIVTATCNKIEMYVIIDNTLTTGFVDMKWA